MNIDEPIHLEGFRGNWSRMFSGEQQLLSVHLDNLVKGIEHFGSTAVDGMVAKPIIDILIGGGDCGKVVLSKKRRKHCWTIPTRKVNSSARCWSGQKRGIQEMHKKRAGRQAALLFFFLSSDD